MNTKEPIAVVGVATSYPEGLSPEQLWSNVIHQRTAFRPMMDERLPISDYNGPSVHEMDRLSLNSAGLLEGWSFDLARFRVPRTLFEAVDTTHWLALDTASQLLESLGTPAGEMLPRETTGVIIGNSLTGELSRANSLRLRWPYFRRSIERASAAAGVSVDRAFIEEIHHQFVAPFPEPGDETLAGSLSNTIAGRICNFYDFHGTGYTVDGACSSSLLAVMAAVTALQNHSLDFAIAGGVDISLDPMELVGFSRLGAMSDTTMRVYDRHPTGFIPGEGAGMVGLMRLKDAHESPWPVLAVIAGAGMSSDGSGGLTRPYATGHLTAATRAYKMAAIEPSEVLMLEGHGTGTAVGDPVELEVFNTLRKNATRPAAVGSIKANIGHTKAAAGIAGLIKAALAIHKAVLPPSTGIEQPHDLLRNSDVLFAPTEPRPWEGQRVAGVSAMGFGGINTHLVLRNEHGRGPKAGTRIPRSAKTGPDEIWLISAPTSDDLSNKVMALQKKVRFISDSQARDLGVHTTSCARLDDRWRISFVARHRTDVVSALESAVELLNKKVAQSETKHLSQLRGVYMGRGHHSVGLLFPGQGAPNGAGSVLEYLVDPSDSTRVCSDTLLATPATSDTRYAQPRIVAGSLLGVAWLNTLGVTAKIAAGHSLGELTALAWAGSLTIRDAIELAARRGEAMADYGTSSTGMLSLALDEKSASTFIAEYSLAHGQPSDVLTVAGLNSPEQTTVAGATRILDEFAFFVQTRGITAVRLAVSHAFHSPAMCPVQSPLETVLAATNFASLHADLVSSTVEGDLLPQLSPHDLRDLLRSQITSPVRYIEAVRAAADRVDLLLECGSGSTLTGLTAACVSIPTLTLDITSSRSVATSTAALAAAGALESLDPWLSGRKAGRDSGPSSAQLITNPTGLKTFHGHSKDSAVDSAADRTILSHSTNRGIDRSLLDDETRSAAPIEDDLPQPASSISPEASATSYENLSSVQLLTDLLAENTGLDPTSLTPDLRLMADLHLNSLRVGQIVNQAIIAFRKRAPERALTLTEATIAEAADLIAGLPAASQPSSVIEGAQPWVGEFIDGWYRLADREKSDGSLRTRRYQKIEMSDEPDGDVDVATAGAVRSTCLETPNSAVAVFHNGGFASLARSIYVESDSRRSVLSIETSKDLPMDSLDVPVLPDGFHDLWFDGGDWHERRTVSHQGGAFPLQLGPEDVCLVTGGVNGITAECAVHLASATKCSLVFVARSSETSPEILSAIRRMQQAGLDATYFCADLTDPLEIAAAVEAASRHGAVTGLLHGAGINVPRPAAEVTAETLRVAREIKESALIDIVKCISERATPKMLVTFGSIIGRAGLQGQADYSIANGRLRNATEKLDGAFDGAVVRHLEWSVWSGVGMGVTLGVLESLAQIGVSAIGPVQGRESFWRAITTGGPTTRLIMGRFPSTPTLKLHASPSPALRFLERNLEVTPGAEHIAQSKLSTWTDLSLNDHRVDGIPVLPAVMSMEAISQVGSAMVPGSTWTHFENIDLSEPVVTDSSDAVHLRVATAVTQPGVMAATVRSSTDEFSAVNVRATVRVAELGVRITDSDHAVAAPLDHFYGPLFFHGAAFKRVTNIEHVTASSLEASVNAHHNEWFAPLLPQHTLLGDPGLWDAGLHVIQVCYPHRRLLPTRIGSMQIHRPVDSGEFVVSALEKSGLDSEEVIFDVSISHPVHGVVATLGCVTFRAVASISGQVSDPRLIAPLLARRVREEGLASDANAIVTAGTTDVSEALTALGRGGLESHSPSGRLELIGGSASTSTCELGRLTACASGKAQIGVDWDIVGEQATIVSQQDQAFVNALQAADVPELVARLVPWTCREALTKAGASISNTFEIRSLIWHDGGFSLVSRIGSTMVAVTEYCQGFSLLPTKQVVATIVVVTP